MSRNAGFEELSGRKKAATESAAGVSLLKVVMSTRTEQNSIKHNARKIKQFKDESKKKTLKVVEKVDIIDMLHLSGIVSEDLEYIEDIESIELYEGKINSDDCFEIISFISESYEGVLDNDDISLFFDMIRKNNITTSMIIYGEWAMKEEIIHINELIGSQKKEMGIKGIFVCRNKNCKNDEVLLTSAQTRSADEGTSIRLQCTKCKRKWVEQ